MDRRTILAAEPFTLMLGAGFFGFFAHTGLLTALEEAGLRPRRVVGVSAGALAGGLWASGLPAAKLEGELCRLRREDFWDPGPPFGGLLRGLKFQAKLRSLLDPLGVERIESCKTPFSAIVHDVIARRPLALDRGALDLAIRASCAVPLMFRPIWHQRRLLVDGGVSDRSGVIALQPGERVLLHYLPSRRKITLGPKPTAPTTWREPERFTLITPDLPRVTPFHLPAGPLALRKTRDHVRRWLDERVSS